MKAKPKIIYDSEYGYEIGYLIEVADDDGCIIELASGIMAGVEMYQPNKYIYEYSEELINLLTKKYKYEKRFATTF